MEYITHKRFKQKSLTGDVNIPALSKCECENNIIFHDGRPICLSTSENGHQYFAINNDGKGLERGQLTQYIQKRLAKQDGRHDDRWYKVWNDKLCQRYKRVEHDDHWLWNDDFFKASIGDLQYIANLIG